MSSLLRVRWPLRFGSSGLVKTRAAKCLEYLNTQHDGFLSAQEAEQKDFEQRLSKLDEVIDTFSQFRDLQQVREVAEKAEIII